MICLYTQRQERVTLLNSNQSLISAICITYVWIQKKCVFMVWQGKILGHIVSKNGISIDEDKIKVILQLSRPINSKQVQGFMGHYGYYQSLSFDLPTLLSPYMLWLSFLNGQKSVKFHFRSWGKHWFMHQFCGHWIGIRSSMCMLMRQNLPLDVS